VTIAGEILLLESEYFNKQESRVVAKKVRDAHCYLPHPYATWISRMILM